MTKVEQSKKKVKTDDGPVSLYEQVKEKVFEFEKTNQTRLVTFVSKGGRWKMGGNSALIYYHEVAKRIGAEPKLNPDRDFYSKFSTGIISIKDIQKLTEKLAKVDIKLIKDSETTKVFDLGQKVTKEQIDTFRKAEDMKRKKVNQVVLPKVVLPDVYVHLMDINQIAFNALSKVDPVSREYLAMDMAKATRNALMTFIGVARGDIDFKKGMNTIDGLLTRIDVMLKLLMELKIWKLDTCVRFTDLLVDTKNLIGKEIEKLV